MSAPTTRTSYASLHLTVQDLPNDVEVLQEAIRQMAALLRPTAESLGMVVNGIHFMPAEKRILQFIAASEFVTAPVHEASTNRTRTVFYRTKRKAKKIGIYFPRQGHVVSPALRQAIRAALGVAKALDFSCTQYNIAGLQILSLATKHLPMDVDLLKDMALGLIGMLRGNTDDVPFVLPAGQKIILSTLYTQPGYASHEKLLMALYTPFSQTPATTLNLAVQVSRLRRAIKGHDIPVLSHSSMGYSLNAAGRAKIAALQAEAPVQLIVANKENPRPPRGRGRPLAIAVA